MTTRQSPNGHHPGTPHLANDWDRDGYTPSPATQLKRCQCGASWLDDDQGRHAHRVVFGHQPRTLEPAKQEDPP